MTITFGPGVCGSLEESSKREWLVTDGLGGYAMGTVAGLRTRRYHGLLIVAVDGPAARMLGLAALDPVLVVGDARFRLATDEWGDGTVDPRGHELLATLHARSRRAALALAGRRRRRGARAGDGPRPGRGRRGPPAACAPTGPVRLELTPLCTWRNVHGERFADGTPSVEPTADGFVFEGAYRVAGPGWAPGGDWYRGVRWREEAARGLNDREDLWAAGSFSASLEPGQTLEVTAAAAPFDGALPRAGDLVQDAKARADGLCDAAPGRRTPSIGSSSSRPTSS